MYQWTYSDANKRGKQVVMIQYQLNNFAIKGGGYIHDPQNKFKCQIDVRGLTGFSLEIQNWTGPQLKSLTRKI